MPLIKRTCGTGWSVFCVALSSCFDTRATLLHSVVVLNCLPSLYLGDATTKLDFSVFHSFVELAFLLFTLSFINSLLYKPSPFTHFRFFLSPTMLWSISLRWSGWHPKGKYEQIPTNHSYSGSHLVQVLHRSCHKEIKEASRVGPLAGHFCWNPGPTSLSHGCGLPVAAPWLCSPVDRLCLGLPLPAKAWWGWDLLENTLLKHNSKFLPSWW